MSRFKKVNLSKLFWNLVSRNLGRIEAVEEVDAADVLTVQDRVKFVRMPSTISVVFKNDMPVKAVFLGKAELHLQELSRTDYGRGHHQIDETYEDYMQQVCWRIVEVKCAL